VPPNIQATFVAHRLPPHTRQAKLYGNAFADRLAVSRISHSGHGDLWDHVAAVPDSSLRRDSRGMLRASDSTTRRISSRQSNTIERKATSSSRQAPKSDE